MKTFTTTALVADATGLVPPPIVIAGDATGTSTVNILNNIFYSTGSGPSIFLSSTAPGIKLERNDYWVTGAPGTFSAGVGATVYPSLASWIAASPGEETERGRTIGLVADPMLVNETVSDLPIGSVDDLMLAAESPLRREADILGAWSRVGLGHTNLFGKPTNPRAVGAG